MLIIRDNELRGLLMIPLLVQYGFDRCNVRDCKERPTTVVTEVEQDFAICEKHYLEFKAKGEINCTLDF